MNKLFLEQAYKKIAPNFMTPKVREWEITGDGRVIELSEGNGIDGRDIYGVTEFEEVDGWLQTTRRGQMHSTIISARKHYNNLK